MFSQDVIRDCRSCGVFLRLYLHINPKRIDEVVSVLFALEFFRTGPVNLQYSISYRNFGAILGGFGDIIESITALLDFEARFLL